MNDVKQAMDAIIFVSGSRPGRSCLGSLPLGKSLQWGSRPAVRQALQREKVPLVYGDGTSWRLVEQADVVEAGHC
jgi:hypothetical protein